jgi:sigma-B regulation protein RsbU (phosphoserine phosphatase)
MSELTKMEKLFLHAGHVLNTTIEYEELMRLVLELTAKATEAEAAMVYRVDKDVAQMRVRFMLCCDNEATYFKVPKGEGIIGWVAENRESIIVNNPNKDKRFSEKIDNAIDINLKSALAVPLIGRGQMIGVVEAINKINGEFDEGDLDTLVGLANQFAVAIDNANLYRDARQSADQQMQLYEVSKKLSSTLNLDEVLHQIMISLKRIVDYKAGGIYLLDKEKDELDTAYSVGYDEEIKEYLKVKIGQGLVGASARTGEPLIIGDVTKDERFIRCASDIMSEIVVPIKINGRILGILNLESIKKNAFNRKTLDLLMAFTSQAAVSIDRANMHHSLLESRRLEEQLNIARNIQLTFLPKRNPDIKGFDISGINIPSEEVGGDYFDFIRIIPNQMGIAIADVSGKGIPASLLMASFRASLIAEIRNNYAIRTICKKVNSLLYESVEQGNYVTAFYGVLDSKNDIFTFSNCGHNLPILIRANGSIEYLQEGGPALGVIEKSEYEERPVFLQSGDLIAFYTDGVTEVYDKNGAEFGQDKLIDALKEFRGLSAVDMQGKIIERVKSFASREHMFDDLTMIIIKKL